MRLPSASTAREEVLARIELDELFAEHGVELRRRGQSSVGCCPFHAEKTGSLTVYADGHFHCYGCGAHGTAIDVVMRLHHVGFREALALLAGRVGVSLRGGNARPWSRPTPSPREQRVTERATVLDDLHALELRRQQISATAAGSPALADFFLHDDDELAMLADRELLLIIRLDALTQPANPR